MRADDGSVGANRERQTRADERCLVGRIVDAVAEADDDRAQIVAVGELDGRASGLLGRHADRMPDPLAGRGDRLEQRRVDPGDRRGCLERPLADLLQVERRRELADEAAGLRVGELPHHPLQPIGRLPDGRLDPGIRPVSGTQQRHRCRDGEEQGDPERSDQDQRDLGQSWGGQ